MGLLVQSCEHRRHSLGLHGGCLRNHDAPALSVIHHALQPGSGLFRPVFNIVQLHCSASVLFCLPSTVSCNMILAMDSDGRCGQFPSLDRGKEWFIPASVAGDLITVGR